jgi:CRP-like cAMP-binding protein
MYDVLSKHIAQYIALNDEEFARCTTFFMPRKLRKRSFLVQEGEVCKYAAFVQKGCLRSYTVDQRGDEHVLQFAIEGWWISDMYSFLTGEPTNYYIEALEDSELLLLDRQAYDQLSESIPKFERFFRILLQNNLIATQRRIIAEHSKTAVERYLDFLQTYPSIVERVPLRHIASYLGITPEALSRIRRELASKEQDGKPAQESGR